MGKPESRIESKLRDGVKALGGKAYKFVSPGSGGVPDRVVCLPQGRVVFVETKSPTGTPSKRQEHRIREMKNMGQDVRILNSVELVNKFLKEMRLEIYGGNV